MLVLRTALRSRFGLKVIISSTRWYRSTPRGFYPPLVRPNSWRARLWYRPDGTRRSKWKGIWYTTTAFSLLLLARCWWEASDIAGRVILLGILIQVQRADANYSSYDLSKSADLLSYLADIIRGVTGGMQLNENIIQHYTQSAENLMKTVPGFREFLRDELEKIHAVLIEDSARNASERVETVLGALETMFHQLIKVALQIQGVNFGHMEDEDGKFREDMYELVG